jgi:hypothetical protein
MPTTTGMPSLMDDMEFLHELEGLDRRDLEQRDGQDAEQLDRRDRRGEADEAPVERRFWEQRLSAPEGSTFVEPDDPEPSGTALTRVSVDIGLLAFLVVGAIAGAGAAALVFHDRLAFILR